MPRSVLRNRLEERVGPEGRKLFEQFLRKVNKLQAQQQLEAQAQMGVTETLRRTRAGLARQPRFAGTGFRSHTYRDGKRPVQAHRRGRSEFRFENNVPPPTRHRCVRDLYRDRTRVSPRRSRCSHAPELG